MIDKRYLQLAVAAVLLGLCLSCGTSGVTEPDGGPLFKAELEHYHQSFDAETSQFPIERSPCVNASNDSTISGLDVPGEWIMVWVDVPEDGTYRPYLDYAAEQGAVISVKLEMAGCGTSTTANFLLTDGTGIG
jgi:hypothetical protein